MVRLRLSLLFALMGAAVVSTAGCGGGGGSHAPTVPNAQAQPAGGPTPSPFNGPQAATTFTITIPAPNSSGSTASGRRPRYIPSTTRSISFLVLEVNGGAVTETAQTTNVTPGSTPCSTVSSSDYTCTITLQMPIGTDETQISIYDANGATGNLLAETLYSAAVVEGHANTFGSSGSPITLDANPGTVSVSELNGEGGSQSGGFTVNGTAEETYSLSVADAHGSQFVAGQQGLPAFNNAASGGCSGTTQGVTGGTTLDVTPSGSCGALNVVVDADPAAATDVTATLTDSPIAGATTFTVSVTSGTIFVGHNLVVDYENFAGGSTLLQESVKVTAVSGSTITISPGFVHAHTSGANVRHYADNLSPATAPFTVSIATSVIAPVGIDSSNNSEAIAFSNTFGEESPGTLIKDASTSPCSGYTDGGEGIPGCFFGDARFDAADLLFIADQGNEQIYESQYTQGSGFSGFTVAGQTGTVIPEQSGEFGFDVSENGTAMVANCCGTTPTIQAWTAGATSSSVNYTTSLGPTWYTQTQDYFTTAAVLANSSNTVFGYATLMFDTSVSAADVILVTTGSGSEQDFTDSGIYSLSGQTSSNFATLAWDQGRQTLIYGNSQSSGGYQVWEYPRNGTTGASITATGKLEVASLSGWPQYIAPSRDGAYIAIAWYNGSTGDNVSVYHFNGTAWALYSGTNPLAGYVFPQFTSVHFLPGSPGNLVITDSGMNESSQIYANLYQFTAAGTTPSGITNPTSIESDFASSSYTVYDCAISY
jgi:hypothetical protein